jgi:hypothetical protein
MKMRFLFAGVLTSVAAVSVAFADEIPPCPAPANVVAMLRLSTLPSALGDRLRRDAGPMVNPGEAFDATDVIMTSIAWRLIFAWNRGRIWIVATEHGGIAYNDPVFAYRVDGTSASLLETRAAIPRTVCATATKMLSSQHK